MEAKRLSRIHFFNAIFELFLALFTLAPKAYYKCSLHDQLQSTADKKIRREETVELP